MTFCTEFQLQDSDRHSIKFEELRKQRRVIVLHLKLHRDSIECHRSPGCTHIDLLECINYESDNYVCNTILCKFI